MEKKLQKLRNRLEELHVRLVFELDKAKSLVESADDLATNFEVLYNTNFLDIEDKLLELEALEKISWKSDNKSRGKLLPKKKKVTKKVTTKKNKRRTK